MKNFQQVIDLADLVAIADQAGAQLKRSCGEWRGKCPIHGGDNKTAFVVYQGGDRMRWKCYTHDCGGGDVIDFVAKWRNIEPKAAYEWLGGGSTLTPQEAARMAAEQLVKAEFYEAKKRAEYEQALEELHHARAWERYYQNLAASDTAREIWKGRGISREWQDYWALGYNPDFVYKHDDTIYHSPTLTIPIYNGGDQPANIRHRILNPFDPKDKYRPERGGLKALPFIADPWKVDSLPKALVVEGEIKAMVCYMWLDNSDFQLYGIPGKKSFGELAERLRGREVYILFDPDAGEEAREAAKQVSGRYVEMTMKVDDALNQGMLGKSGLRRLLTMGRKTA